MVKVADKNLKCFMLRAKNGGMYRTCATPEKKKQPKKQVRGDPKPASERKLPYLTSKGKQLPKSDRVIKEAPKKPPLPPKSDKVKKRQQELKKKKEAPKKKFKVVKKEEPKKKIKFKPKESSDDQVINKLIKEMNINNLTNPTQRNDMKKSIRDFYLNGAKNKMDKRDDPKVERPFKVRSKPRDDDLVNKFRNAYIKGVKIIQVGKQTFRPNDLDRLLRGKNLPNDSRWQNKPLLPDNLELLRTAFSHKWYKAT